MRLFLDASMSPALGDALAARGFDVIAQRRVLPTNSPDTAVLAAALADRRVVLARDYDMAELVLRGFSQAIGVIIVAIDVRGIDAVHIIEPGRIRRRPFELSS